MSETRVATPAENGPKTIYLKDYQVPVYLVDEIHLEFDLHDDYARVTSTMHIRHNRHTDVDKPQLKLNGEELILESIKLNGQALTESQYTLSEQFLILRNLPEIFDLQITVKIFPQKNTALSGLYRSGKTFCTQCEPEGFRRITFFPDHPDILSRYTTKIIADAKQYPMLLSNGNLIESGQLENGRHWAKWEDPFKKPCYLFALVAGDFDLLEDSFVTQSNRKIDLKIYVDKGYLSQTHHAMHCVKEAMKWDETAYGREYDLDIYMIVAIGDFNMGAMENKGLNIFNTKYILAKPETATDDDYIHILSVIGHEYFHNWSGNRVTCRDWFQLSLKEGLTIFRDQSFTEDTLSKAVMRIRDVTRLREVQFPEDAGPLAHAVQPDSYIEINNFYTPTIYEKGAEVLRMLQTILGVAQFRKGMDLYFARHDGQAVTIEDFVATMEDVSGIDLKQFRYWYTQSGTPIVKVKSEYDQAAKRYTLQISQHTAPTAMQKEKRPLYIPIRTGLLYANGKSEPEKLLCLTEASQSFVFENITSKPIPSLLRNFSAPVKLIYPYTDEELIYLFEQDEDAFNRWEAGQQYILRIILKLISDYKQGQALQLPQALPDMFEHILKLESNDKFLLVEMLSLPSEKYIGEQMEMIDVDAIHAVREFVLAQIATRLENLFLKTYQKYHVDSANYKFGMEEIGKRQLKNLCLAYLLFLPKYAELGQKQFSNSLRSNMTDTQVAFHSLVNLDSPMRAPAIQAFYEAWSSDALVMDKWLAIQATCKLPGTFEQVKKLMSNPVFDIKNPNKVYSLIGAFANRNHIYFHAKSGEGYVFLRECVEQLDKLNPQVAGRMVNPLTTWKRYDKERQQLMRQQLEKLLTVKNLSTDLYELVTKSLE